ncbi:HlyD family type I secretion periplasmic adaptor subunit, partial [Halomonas citrativorans]|uniref:HlyD family type I secretion periplasmic adaptor subunit n=2 Tax=Halomonas TaxID=2745 RepID=UPI00186600EF
MTLRDISQSPPDAKPHTSSAIPDWQALAMRRKRRPLRIGSWLLLGGLALFVAWAAWAPLDNGIAVPATVVVSGNRQAVEHPTGGTVERLWVRDGDRVDQGRPLVSLDTTQLQNEAEVLRLQHASALAEAARLEAERDGQASITFPPELMPSGDADIDTLVSQQRLLFASRRSALDAELAGLAASLAGQRAQVTGLEASLSQQRTRLDVLSEQRRNLSELASGGYIPRNRMLEFEGSYVQLQGDIASANGTLQQTQRQIDELELRLTQRQEEYQREVGEALAQARLRGQEAAGRMANNAYEQAHAVIRAPRSGR